MRFIKLTLLVCIIANVIYSQLSDEMVLELDSNQVVDSLENEILSLKKDLLKDQLFSRCRNDFFEGDFMEQCSFFFSLKKYEKTDEFILELFQNFLKIKKLEKEQLQAIADNMEASNEKGIVRLHIKSKRDQISKINDIIYKLSPKEEDTVEIEHLVPVKLVLE